VFLLPASARDPETRNAMFLCTRRRAVSFDRISNPEQRLPWQPTVRKLRPCSWRVAWPGPGPRQGQPGWPNDSLPGLAQSTWAWVSGDWILSLDTSPCAQFPHLNSGVIIPHPAQLRGIKGILIIPLAPGGSRTLG